MLPFHMIYALLYPLLTASNLEYGGNGSAIEGTYFGREMLVAATHPILTFPTLHYHFSPTTEFSDRTLH